MVGRSITSIFQKREVPLRDVAIEVHNLNDPSFDLHGILFSVKRGEIFGLAGWLALDGQSQREHYSDLLLPPGLLKNNAIHVRSPADPIRLGIRCPPEDRRQHD